MTLPLHDPDDAALARTLGQAGLIPFVMLAGLLWLVDVALQPWVAIAEDVPCFEQTPPPAEFAAILSR